MGILAIDTSTSVMGIALSKDGVLLGEWITNLKKNHSVRLMPAIHQLMAETKMSPADLSRIVVAKGPGSYTGVRIGVTTAKAMAWALSIPIYGVSSLQVLAQNGNDFDGFICPMFDARRGQVYTGLFRKTTKRYAECVIEDRSVPIVKWLDEMARLHEPILFLGNDTKLHEEMIRQFLGDRAVFALLEEHVPRPSKMIALTDYIEPERHVHALIPNYVQLAEAEAKWLAHQKRNGKDHG